jgi:rhomboid protease GluP
MNNPFEPQKEPYSSGKPVHPLERPMPVPQQPSSPPSTAAPVRRVAIPQSQPILSYGILALNIVIFVLDQYVLNGLLTNLGVKDNAAILSGELWRFLTPVFLHANLIHIGVNSYSLYIIGPQVERSYGHARFAAIYLLSGIAGVIASFAFSPYESLGASGALFGLIGAMLPLLYRNRKVLQNTQRSIVAVVEVIVINLLIGLIPGIDDWAHGGGLISGLALSWFATPLYKVIQDFDGSIRIKDESASGMVWAAILVLGAAILGAAYLAILLRQGGVLPRV